VDYPALPANDLLTACIRGDADAWEEFVRRFHPLIARVVLRVALQWREPSPHVVDDLIQETYLKLCANRSDFLQRFNSTHENALFGYIKVFTANLAHDHFKASHAQRRDSAVTASLSADTRHGLQAATVSSSAAMDRTVLIEQIDSCLKAITSGAKGQRDRRIFWLYYRVGLSANAIAALPSIGLSTKGVETTLLRLNRQIRGRLVDSQCSASVSADREVGNPPTESL
jgi:RNA polymerase sigma-70 factor, ECF subfamily